MWWQFKYTFSLLWWNFSLVSVCIDHEHTVIITMSPNLHNPCYVWKTMFPWCYWSLLIVIFYIYSAPVSGKIPEPWSKWCSMNAPFLAVHSTVIYSLYVGHVVHVCGNCYLLQKEASLMRTGRCSDPFKIYSNKFLPMKTWKQDLMLTFRTQWGIISSGPHFLRNNINTYLYKVHLPEILNLDQSLWIAFILVNYFCFLFGPMWSTDVCTSLSHHNDSELFSVFMKHLQDEAPAGWSLCEEISRMSMLQPHNNHNKKGNHRYYSH